MADKRYARRTYIEITIAGTDVTKDLSPYLIQFNFNDKTNNEVDDISITLDDRDELFMTDWMPTRGDVIECSIVSINWDNDNNTDTYYCGRFEIDEISLKGLPNTIEVKAVSCLNSEIRRQLYTKAWEKITVREICQQIANKHSMKLNFNTSNDIEDMEVDRIDQSEQSDFSFLVQLADDYGCKVKIYDGELIFYEEQELINTQDISMTFSRFELTDYNMRAIAYDLYKECKLSYFDPKTKKKQSLSVTHKHALMNNREWELMHGKRNDSKKNNNKASQHYSTYTYLDQANVKGGGKTLFLRRKFSNNKQAEAICKKALMDKNKGEWSADFTCSKTLVMSGILIYLEDFGNYSGVYLIDNASHSVTKSGGYQVRVSSHRLLGSINNEQKSN